MPGNSSMAGTDNMESWRELFRGRDIYDVIGKAILIAATDSPKEFRRRRDGIVEQIYTAPASTIAIPTTLQGRSAGGEVSGSALQQVSEKGSKVASCTVVAPSSEEPEVDEIDAEGITDKQGNGYGDNANAVDEVGMDWLESIADEMDEETQEINEVLRIKEILLNHLEQSTDILFESLRRLQLMQLTADKIKSTEIGRAVAALSKHRLQKIRMLVREIIKGWKSVVDDWIAVTKATVYGDSSECYSYKSQDISNQLAAEDGGLAIPPMDVGALFLVSHATAMQNVSEFLHGMDDDGIMTNVITGMDKGGSSGSNNNRKYDGVKPSDTVPRNKDLIIVQDLPVTQRPPADKMNPQKLPARQRTPSKNTGPTQKKLLNADGNSLLRQQCQRSDLPARQGPALLQKSNIQKTQEQGSQVLQVPCIRIKIKHSSPGCAPRRLSEKTLEKKPCEENPGTVTVARNPPLFAAAGVLPSGQAIKTRMAIQSSAEPNKLGTGRKVQLANMNLDETKRKLHGAHQEAESAKKKRAIQVVKPCDIPKSKDISRTPLTTSMNPVSRTTPLMKSMNHISRTPSIKEKSHIIRSWEHDGCK